LSVLNADAVLNALNDDTTCGFSAPSVLGSAVLSGTPGTMGSLTIKVKDCVMDFGTQGKQTEPDCKGVYKTNFGKVTATATKTIVGMVTGDPANPIIPTAYDAATLELQGTFENYYAKKSDSDTYMVWVKGGISGKTKPLLAVAKANGLCSIQTDHTMFWDVAYTPSVVQIVAPSAVIGVDVDKSNLKGMSGRNPIGDENRMEGTISVWGGEVKLPLEGDKGGLNPDFDFTLFEENFNCDPGLAKPTSFRCGSVLATLADNGARLTVSSVGTVAGLVASNSTCGFATPAVVGAEETTGTVGEVGTVTRTITDCVIELPAATALGTDCTGASKGSAGGKVTVSGTQVFSGVRTGNPAAPVIPASDSPVVLDLTLVFDNFTVTSGDGTTSLTHRSGALHAALRPRVALDLDGACSIQTGITEFSDLRYTDGVLSLASSLGTFGFTISDSDFYAVAGNWGPAATNVIDGTVEIDGTTFRIPTDGLGLNPAYDEAAYNNGWQCQPKLYKPVSHQCLPTSPYAQAAARGLIKVVGVATSLLDGNTTCGFNAPAVLGAGVATCASGGAPPCAGDMVWTVGTACEVLNVPDPTPAVKVSSNCATPAQETYVHGKVVATGTKTLTGNLTGANPPIVPVSREAGVVALTELTLTDFVVYDLAAGDTNPPKLRITFTGTVTGTLRPIGGESATNAGVYSIFTPVARFENIAIKSGTITLEQNGVPLRLELGAAELDALNGSFAGESNALSGAFNLLGVEQALLVPMLDPAFNQATFDAGYACTPDLKEPVPAN
jgi:hypothetical protein